MRERWLFAVGVPLGCMLIVFLGLVINRVYPQVGEVAVSILGFVVLGGIFYVVFLLVLGVVNEVIQNRSDAREKVGQCRVCGYSLKGNLSGTCPECGTPIRRFPAE